MSDTKASDFPAAGVWKFKNVGTHTYLNLWGGAGPVGPGTLIVGHREDGTPHNLWQLAYIDKDKGTFNLQPSVPTRDPLFVQPTDQEIAPGSKVVSGLAVYTFKFKPANFGRYRIVLVEHETITLSLPNADDGKPVELQVVNLSDDNQLWKPVE